MRRYYEQTPEEPSDLEYAFLREHETSRPWTRSGESIGAVIADLCEATPDIAEDIRRFIFESQNNGRHAGAEAPFDRSAHYQERASNDRELNVDWDLFKKSLTTEARFFNEKARAVLVSNFEGINGHTTWDGDPVILECGPGREISELYRARVFQRDADVARGMERPDLHLGPPPPERATAGRMNARGISIFYGALDAQTALAEVRPPVGSKVLIALFEIIRPIRLLDVRTLHALQTPGSVFDPSFTRRLEKADFLTGLNNRISAPVMPDDEAIEYLATQAVADFLANEVNPPVDGIIYKSVQSGNQGSNVALFHRSSRVKALDLPKGTEFETTLYREGRQGSFRLSCSTTAHIPPPGHPATTTQEVDGWNTVPTFPEFNDLEDPDERDVTLKVDLESVTLHLVKATRLDTESKTVHRY